MSAKKLPAVNREKRKLVELMGYLARRDSTIL